MALTLRPRRKPSAPARPAKAYRSKQADILAALEADGWTPATLAFAGPHRAQQALTAAATRVETATSQDIRRLIQPWQARALTYYDMIGEVNFSSQFYSRTLAKVETFAAVLDDDGNPQRSDDKTLIDLWDRVQDPSGGRSELQASYGRLMFIIGEGYLTCTPDPDWGEVWEFLSPSELRVQPGGIFVRYRAPQIGTQEYVNAPDDQLEPLPGDGTSPDQVIAYRLWKKHPAYSWWADSSMHAVLDVLEELLLLTLAVRSQAKSRAANNGILLWPDEMALPSMDTQGQEDSDTDPFFQDFEESWLGPINNPGSAAAGVPLFVRMSKDMIAEADGGPRFLKFDANDSYAETGMRSELIRRYAMGVDLPPEELLGMTDVNHWTGWIIDENSWKAHLLPVTQRMCSDFASAYLRPAARDAGFADWRRVTVGYDATEVINHPDRTKDAKDAFDKGELSGEALLRYLGFDPATDAPDERERLWWLGAKIHDGSLAVDGIPSVRGNIEPSPGVIEGPAGSSSDAPTSGAGVDAGPPSDGPADENVPLTAAARILGGADVTVERCRALAGARLKRRAQNTKCGDCLERINGSDNALVASALGDMLDGLADGDSLALVAGGAQDLVASAVRQGVDHANAALIGAQIEQWAADTLHLPDAGELPARLLETIREACDG